MNDYEITYLVDPETLTDELVDELYDAYDCLAGGRPHGGAFVTLTVPAASAEAAIKRGLGNLQQHGLRVVDVDRDLVDVAEIALRTNTSRQTVHNWINGRRQGDGFPAVFTDAGRGLWLWGEVQEWALKKRIYVEDPDMRYPSRSDHDQASFHVRHRWGRPFVTEHLWGRRERPALDELEVERLVIAYTTAARTRPEIVVDTRHDYSDIVASTNRERARRRPAHVRA